MKIVITDPCYRVKDGKIWKKFIDTFWDNNKIPTKAIELIKEYLELPWFSFAETGYGDWGNEIQSKNAKSQIIQSDFCADAGLVCACPLTPKIARILKDVGDFCYAVVNVSDDVTVHFDCKDPDWTVVDITDNETGAIFNSIRSLGE